MLGEAASSALRHSPEGAGQGETGEQGRGLRSRKASPLPWDEKEEEKHQQQSEQGTENCCH